MSHAVNIIGCTIIHLPLVDSRGVVVINSESVCRVREGGRLARPMIVCAACKKANGIIINPTTGKISEY